jgi:uncharacterized protein (TIGR03435 family)
MRLVTLVLVAAQALGAAQESQRPAFDAASVKLNTSRTLPVRISTFPGRFSASNVSLRMLVRNAYSLQDFQMSGGPNWMDADRFDVDATAGGSTTFDRIRAMTRTLLQDRFKLVAHNETRELPIYILTVARRDGKLGDQIKQAGTECKPIAVLAGAPPPPPPPPGGAAPNAQCPSMLALGGISGRRLAFERVVATLSQYVGRRIVDKTNLTGAFDLDLQWVPDQLPDGGRGLVPIAPFDPNGPSLFTALQEQLGLKLESSRGPVEVLVIDAAEKPSAD